MKLPSINALLYTIIMTTAPAPQLQAAVYQYVDENGDTVYSDQPRPGATQVTVPSTNTTPAVQAKPKTNQPPTPTAVTPRQYQSLRITAPADDTAIPSADGDFTVVVALQPNLRPGHQLQLWLDAEPVQHSQTGTFELRNIYRGSHTLQVKVVNRKGLPLKQSTPITVHVFRPSLLFGEDDEE